VSDALSTLCLHCGLCCDGTLFRHVEITPGERERLVQLGIGVGVRRKHEVMWLPCGKLDGKRCTIYEQRPGGCARFVCALGRRLTGKEVSLDAAMAQVDLMHQRLAALRAAFPDCGDEPILRFARARIDSPTAQVTEEQLAAFKAVEELRYADYVPPLPVGRGPG